LISDAKSVLGHEYLKQNKASSVDKDLFTIIMLPEIYNKLLKNKKRKEILKCFWINPPLYTQTTTTLLLQSGARGLER